MNCQKYQELISCLIDGELSDAEKARLENHIASCPECRAMYEDFAALSCMMDGGMEEVPDSLHDKIMSGVKAAKRAKKPLIIRLRPYMAAAACLVVAVGAVFAMRNGAGYDMSANSTSAAAPGAASYGYSGGATDDSLADCAMPADTPAEAPRESAEESTESYFSGSDMADSNAGAEAPRSEESATNEPAADYGIDGALNDIQLTIARIDSAALITLMTDGSTKSTAISDLEALSEALEPMDFHDELDFVTSALLELKCGSEIFILELCYAGEALIVRYDGEYWFGCASVEEFLAIE